jgi:hypothetical protein
VQYWQSSLKMIAAHPWLGCGPGNFQAAYPQYKLPQASEEIADPHNFLLEIWATAGAPALLAFLAVLGCFAWGFRVQRSVASAEPQAANAESLIPNLSSDGWLYVLGGGVVGFLLSVPLGILSTTPVGLAPVLLGLPLAAATVALLSGWIREGRLPRWLPGVCVVALLVSLLAAGGIAFPGIAGTFWLLLALALEGRYPRTLPTYMAWTALAGFLALSVACFATAYSPVLNCRAELHLAELRLAKGDRGGALPYIEAAVAADPLSSDAWAQLAAVELEAWYDRPDEAAFARFAEARNKALGLAANSPSMWLTAGDWASRVYSKADDHGRRLIPDAVHTAVEAYSRGVQLYPNSALHRAKLAEALFAAGDRSAFRREAETALWLDEVTPHIDKKLPDTLRDSLLAHIREKSQ